MVQLNDAENRWIGPQNGENDYEKLQLRKY